MTQQRENAKAGQPLHKFLLWRIVAAVAFPALILLFGTIFVLQNFNPNRYAPELVAALEHATGRHVTLSGAVKIRWSLTPAIQANSITISNPPGFTGPPVLTLGGLRAEIALLPLISHRLDILRLVLIDPHLTLERLPDGRANWNFSKSPHRAGIVSLTNAHYKLALEAVEIRNGRLTLHSNKGGNIGTIQFTRLTGTAASLSAPLHLAAQAQIGDTPFTLNGTVGPVERFSRTGSTPWPLDLAIAMANATLHVTGTVAHPRDASGYNLTAKLDIPNLAVLGHALPPNLTGNHPLPPLQNITAEAQIKDHNATLPAIDNLTVTAGHANLSTLRPGLTLNGLTIQMAALGQPLSFSASGTSDSGNYKLQGSFGAVQRLFPPSWLPAASSVSGNFPVSLTAQLGGASASISGAIATPHSLSGAALAITSTIPNLSSLSAIAGTELPAWKNIALQATLIDPGGEGLYNILGLDGLTVTMDNAAFGGAATLNITPRPNLQLSLNFTQANADALLAAYPAEAETVSMPPPAVIPATQTQIDNAAPPLIPETPLPLDFLSWGNGNIQLSANNLTWNKASYTALQANIQLSDKILTLSPVTGEVPGGNISASATLNGAQTPPTESLSIKAPALALGPLVRAFNVQGQAEGNAQIQLSATSQGSNLRQMATHLSGQLGVASVNARLDASLLNRAFGTALQTAGIPPLTTSPVTVRCFGVLMDASQGVVTLKSFGIDSGQLLMQGTGRLNLGQEIYALSIQPADGAAVQLGGHFAHPVWTRVPASLPQPQQTSATQRPDICPAILTAARFGQAGPAPPPQATTAPSPMAPTNASAPKNLLNSLLTAP